MSLRNRPTRAAFFNGTRTIQSDLIEVPIPTLAPAQIAFLHAELVRHSLLENDTRSAEFCALVIAAHISLLREARFFVAEVSELVRVNPAGDAAAIAVPAIPLVGDLAASLMRVLAKSCAQAALSGEPIDDWLGGLQRQLAEAERPGPNKFHFLRAARELGMPVFEWQSGHLQVGLGRNSAVLNGSVTHETPGIGTSIARQKLLCNALLAQAGFPVPKGAIAPDLAAARKIAGQLGFPVVVKPSDLDGGKGVSSDIRSAEELDQAYTQARKHSHNIVVEKHIVGKDYRLLLFRGRLLIAIERAPGGVTGNGRDSIAALLDELNRDPQRGPGSDTHLYTLEPDAEAQLMARRQGYDFTSVPPEGQFVPLRRAANFALGGSVRVVEDIHPDNLDLAQRAAGLLRLDLAGLDLLLPDITKSWHETGGAICEVNGQPFIGEPVRTDFQQLILQELVAEGGRIPVVLTLGTPDAATLGAIEDAVPQLAIVDAAGARFEGRPLSLPGLAWAQACQAPLFDPRVAAVLCILDPTHEIAAGSPIDRFSAAFVLETGVIPEAALELLRRAGEQVHALEPISGLNSSQLAGDDVAAGLIAALSAEQAPA